MQKIKSKVYFKKWVNDKAQELADLKKIEHEQETQQILMEHSKQAAHSSPMKHDPNTNMDKLIISYYNDADLKRHKENYQKKNKDEAT